VIFFKINELQSYSFFDAARGMEIIKFCAAANEVCNVEEKLLS